MIIDKTNKKTDIRNGLNSLKQVVLMKRIFYEYKCTYFVMDSKGNGNSIYDYELSRYATTSQYRIIGGFSKLLSYFKNNYKWSKLITYADKRWSNGDLYKKTGWNLIRISKPSYSYIKPPKYNKRYFYF